uniref:Ig-like domain-containing protein n=1 Tax=Octopus bimaculoides TaxID=37653 RepID=A0A0L8HS72_OCTBM
MELKLLYWKHLLTVQCLCVCLQLDDATVKFIKKNHQSTLECFIEKQEIKLWQVGTDKLSAPKWVPLKTSSMEASVNSDKTNILNLTVTSNYDIRIDCQGTEKINKFLIMPLFNDNGNLYPSSETPNAIKDKKFTLKCKNDDTGVIWFTGNGTVIAKYIGLFNQNRSRYFGSRQETHCQNKTCALSITNISLDDDNMSIVCKTNFHTSLFNIRVFVLPKSVTIKAISDTVLVENQNKSYECLVTDTNLEFSVFWLITWKNGTQKNVTKHISNKSSKSGKLTTSSSKLTLHLNKKFKDLQCVAYFPGKSEFVYHSMKLDMPIKYTPMKKITLNVLTAKVCAGTPMKFQCSWKGGNPPASVTLMYKNISNTSKEDVELRVTSSKSHQIVKCLGSHITANVSYEKNITVCSLPERIKIKSDEPFLEGQEGNLHCGTINGYSEKYNYRWNRNNSTSENITLPQIHRKLNNKVYTCYVSSRCNKECKIHKKHWVNVEYVPDITASEDVTLIENQASIVNCSAKGNPIPEVRLECRNHSFPSNSPFTFNRRNISDVFCVANAKSTKHGNLTSRKKINILLKYPPQVNINISEGMYNATIINCTASDGNPEIYEYKLKQKWGNATKNTYNMNVLSINNPSFSNTGTWECHVSNEDFHVNRSSSYKIPVKPIFSSVFNDPKRNVSNGETVIFKQCFYSHPKSDVKWQKNEESIDSDKYSTTDYLSSEFPFKGSCTSLKIEDIKGNDFGIYVLTVENPIGKEVTIFTLRSEEITEDFLVTTICCTVGSVLLLLITLRLLAYKFHKIRAVDDHYIEVSELQNMCLQLPVFEDEHAEDSEPKYVCMKQPNLDAVYANIPKKPDVFEDEHVGDSEPKYVCMKQPIFEDEDVGDSEPKYVCMKQPSVEHHYFEVCEHQNICPEPPVFEDEHAEDSEPKYVCMKQPNLDAVYVNIPKKPDVMDVAYVNLSRRPNDTVNDSLNDIYENNNQRNEIEGDGYYSTLNTPD